MGLATFRAGPDPWFLLVGAGLVALFAALPAQTIRRYARDARRERALLRTGRAVEGVITEITPHPSQQWDERATWRVTYTYEVDGRTLRGEFGSWNSSDALRKVGDPLWVVYLPEAPEAGVPWPPPRRDPIMEP